MEIDAIEQRPGNSLAITLNVYWTATAFPLQISKVTARAGVHGRDQNEFRGKFKFPSAPVAISAVSRKTHGAAGNFDINLQAAGIEDRTGRVAGAHQVIVTFGNTVTVAGATVSLGIGNVGSFSVSGAVVTVNLTGVADVQRITITLVNVNDGTNSGDVWFPWLCCWATPMGVVRSVPLT